MKEKLGFWGLLILVLVLSASGLMAQSQSDFDGAWEFVKMETPNGDTTDQKGMMVVTDGFLCHIRVAKERESFVRDEAEEESARKAAANFNRTNGTCGSFSMSGGKVIVNWTTAVNPGIEGNTSEFVFERSGEMMKIAPAGAPEFKFVYQLRK